VISGEEERENTAEWMTKKERLDAILAKMMNVGNVDGSVIAPRGGLLIVSRVPPEVDDRIVSAPFSSVTVAAETAFVEMGRQGRSGHHRTCQA